MMRDLELLHCPHSSRVSRLGGVSLALLTVVLAGFGPTPASRGRGGAEWGSRPSASPSVRAPAPVATTAALVFDGVSVVDVERGQLLPDQRVVIVGTRIQALGKTSAVPLPEGAQVVDARGKYLIPGLWDWHVHTAMRSEGFFPLFVANGVTGIREAGAFSLDSMTKWRREIWAGTRVGPPRQILSSLPVNGPLGLVEPFMVTGPASVRHAVDSFKAAGADMIKTYRLGSKRLYF